MFMLLEQCQSLIQSNCILKALKRKKSKSHFSPKMRAKEKEQLSSPNYYMSIAKTFEQKMIKISTVSLQIKSLV
jgi:hypothetical protein